MGGFASFIGGAGQGAANLGTQLRQQRFQHQENELSRWQMQHEGLSRALERASAQYAGPEGERLRDLQLEVEGLRPGADLTPYTAKYSQHRQKAAQEVAQAAAQGTQARPTPSIAPVPTPQATPPPFAPLIGAPAPSGAPPAAQSPTSLAQPQQGGGSSSPAAFPQPAAQPVPAVAPVTGAPDSTVPLDTAPPIRSSTLDVPPLLPLQQMLNAPGGSMEAFNRTGYIDPLISSAFGPEVGVHTALEQALGSGQVGLELGRKRLQALDEMGVLDNMPPMLRDLVRAETMMGGTGGNGLSMGAMIGAMTPQSAPGMETLGSLRARIGDDAVRALGVDPEKNHPQTPVRVQYSKLQPNVPIRAEIQSVPLSALNTTEGIDTLNRRTGEVGSPLAGAGGQPLVPLAMAPRTSTSTQTSPGAPPVTTTTTRRVGGVGAPAGGSAVVPPVRGMGTAPKRVSSDSLPAGVKAEADGVAKGDLPMPAGREGDAVRQYMAEHQMPLPTPLNAVGQKALSNIDPILEEVQRLKSIADSVHLDKMNKADLAIEYAKYKLGIDTPLAGLIASTSYADLRSAAQALQNSGSRAYPILVRALEHTPHWGLNPDEPALMRKKIDEMETRLTEARQAIMAEEKRSGVPGGMGPVKGSRVHVIGPDGKAGSVPAEQLQDALKQGYRVP